jgi:hypothetical protein
MFRYREVVLDWLQLVTEYYSLGRNEGVRELQRPHESNKQTVVLPLQNMICGCTEVQETVWVAEALDV